MIPSLPRASKPLWSSTSLRTLIRVLTLQSRTDQDTLRKRPSLWNLAKRVVTPRLSPSLHGLIGPRSRSLRRTLKRFCLLALAYSWLSQSLPFPYRLFYNLTRDSLASVRTDEQLERSVMNVFEQFGTVYVKIRRDTRGMPYAFCQYEVNSPTLGSLC